MFVLVYPNKDNSEKKINAKKHYLPECLTENCKIINGKNFYDQPIDYDIKQY